MSRLEIHLSGPSSVAPLRRITHTLPNMTNDFLPFLDIFLGILGVGLSILFCTSFCRACQRYREAQIEREAWRRSVQDGQPPIYFIPFSGNRSHLDAEDPSREPRYSQDYQPPQYSAVSYGPPPSYNDLGFKPEDLPPAYTEDSPAVLPITPPPHTHLGQPQTQSQQ